MERVVPRGGVVTGALHCGGGGNGGIGSIVTVTATTTTTTTTPPPPGIPVTHYSLPTTSLPFQQSTPLSDPPTDLASLSSPTKAPSPTTIPPNPPLPPSPAEQYT